jgi:uncharacterized protein YbbK (DUF523 family)
MELNMIGVSGCLAGLNCRYDGRSKPDEKALELVKTSGALPFCPECLAGLPAPRAPSEIRGGDGEDVLNGKARVVSRDGRDRTAEFILGAKKTLKFCRENGITEVWLKSKSPSCGVSRIYDGTFSGTKREGMGVTAAYLRQNGIKTVEIL